MPARINVTQINASVASVRLRVGGIGVAQLLVSASGDMLAAQASAVKLAQATSYLSPMLDVSHIELAVASYLDGSGRIRITHDTATTADVVIRLIGKALADTQGTLDANAFALTKILADSNTVIDSSTLVDGLEYGFEKRTIDEVIPADQQFKGLTKPQAETLSTQDLRTTDITKPQSETLSVADAFSRLVSFIRSFIETAPAADLAAKTVSLGNLGDDQYVVNGYVLAGYMARDYASPNDAVRLVLQNYVSQDYFLEDYVGSSYGPY